MISTTMPSDPEEDYIPWIQQFCELFGHDYFVQVSQDFIEDDFNLTGLSLQVPYYREALYTILDYQVETAEDHNTDNTTTNTSNNNDLRNGTSKRNASELPNKALLAFCRIIIWFNPCQIHSLQTRSNCHGIQV